MTKRAVITGVGHYLPKRIVPNSEFEKTLNTSDDWIITRSGIRQRHFSDKNETKVPDDSPAFVVALPILLPKDFAKPPANGIIKIAKRANFQF